MTKTYVGLCVNGPAVGRVTESPSRTITGYMQEPLSVRKDWETPEAGFINLQTYIYVYREWAVVGDDRNQRRLYGTFVDTTLPLPSNESVAGLILLLPPSDIARIALPQPPSEDNPSAP